MAAGDTFLCKIHLNVGGRTGSPCSVGFRFEQFDTNDGPEPCSAIGNQVGLSVAAVQPQLAADVQIASIETKADFGISKRPSLIPIVASVGGIAGESVPLTKAGLVTLEQTDRSAKFHGQNYWPGVPEASTTGNTITAAAWFTALTAFYDAIEILTHNLDAVDYEFFHSIRNPTQIPIFVRVRSTSLSPIMFNQRRRRTRARGPTLLVG